MTKRVCSIMAALTPIVPSNCVWAGVFGFSEAMPAFIAMNIGK